MSPDGGVVEIPEKRVASIIFIMYYFTMDLYYTVITAIGLSCGIYLLSRGIAGFVAESVVKKMTENRRMSGKNF